jgi:hypothetical protein
MLHSADLFAASIHGHSSAARWVGGAACTCMPACGSSEPHRMHVHACTWQQWCYMVVELQFHACQADCGRRLLQLARLGRTGWACHLFNVQLLGPDGQPAETVPALVSGLNCATPPLVRPCSPGGPRQLGSAARWSNLGL